MAAEVKAGEVYTAEKPMNRDNWSMFRVKDKGNEVAIFINENINLQDGDRVRIKKILKTKCGSRQVKDRDGKPKLGPDGKPQWVPAVSDECEVEILDREPSSDFSEEFGDDGSLPF